MPLASTSDSSVNSVLEDSLAKRGRQLTRLVDAFWNSMDVLMLGKQLAKSTNDEQITLRNCASERQKRALALLDKLNELEPNLIERLCRNNSNSAAATRDARSRLNTGQSNGKSEDMRKVKEEIVSWRVWNPPLVTDDKLSCGLNHNECAYFLSPPTVNWDDEIAHTDFISNGNPAMTPSRWPRFLWREGAYNPNRKSEGLLQGELMVRAACAILFSPAAAKTPSTIQASGARGHCRRNRGPIGIAKSYQLQEVTKPFLAYVAMVVRHSLTSDETFSDVCAGFSYIEFYNQIREYLEAPRFERRSTQLINWWNEQLFSTYRGDLANGGTDVAGDGTLADLDAEVEADGSEDEGPNANGNGAADGGSPDL